MTDLEVNEFVRRAEAFYAAKLKAVLEPAHLNEFVAIDPETGDYYLGKTFNEAMQAARKVHPHRLTHAMRIGHTAALHLGLQIR